MADASSTASLPDDTYYNVREGNHQSGAVVSMPPPVSTVRPAAMLAAPGLLVILILLLGNNWGLQYAAAKLAAYENVAPIGSLYFTHLILTSVFAVSLVLCRSGFSHVWRHAGFFIVVSAFTNVGQLGSELIAAQHVSAGELGLINALTPLFIIAIVFIFRTEALSSGKIVAVLLGLGAALTILLPEMLSEELASASWTAFAFVSPISAAIGVVILARFWPDNMTTLQAASGTLFWGTLWISPIALISGEPLGLSGGWTMGDFATVLFMLTVGAEFYLLAYITRLGGAVFVGCADFIAVCAGLMWGFIFFTEIPTLWMLLATVICFAALKLAAKRTAAQPAPAVLPA